MDTMKNISRIGNCYGCGVCSAVCPKNIIKIRLNDDGFYGPWIEKKDLCLDCGLCLEVCSFNQSNLVLQENPFKSWAAWSNDECVRRKCSSGGIGFEIGKQLIERGYKAVACRYDIKEQRAEHFVATTVEEYVQSIGSKYIQSYTEEAFKQIKRKDEKYLVTGTPCQIDSFRRMIQKFRCEDNFILMDFFCHSVPSMWAWKAYIKMLEPKIGKVTYASWRNKYEYGWHDSYNLLIKGEKSFIQSRWSQGDLFYKLFLGDMCSGTQCEKKCKYKWDKSSADIRIGDLWGNLYKNNEEGVNALIAFTEKGRLLIESLQGISLINHPFEVVAEGQMRYNAKSAVFKPLIMHLLKNGVKMDSTLFRLFYNMQRIVNVIRIRMLK